MTQKEWAELEEGEILSYEKHTYRTAHKDPTGRWIVEKLDLSHKPVCLVTLNVNDKRLKSFKLVKNHIASSEVQRKLQQAERNKIQ
jgi:hypothetical protein